MRSPVEVLVVDDQTLVRRGICSLLGLLDGVQVRGEAGDGQEALDLVAASAPDLILLDLRMPKYDGIWLLRAMRERGIDVPVLILTTFNDDDLVLSAIQHGARGYLLKDVTLETLDDAIASLAAGGSWLQPALSRRVLDARGTAELRPGDAERPIEPLTIREGEILQLLANGHTNREIATALRLAEGTVKNHVSSILLKLGTTDRTKAVLRALHEGLLGN